MGGVVKAVNRAIKGVRKISEKIGLAGLPKAVKNIARKAKKLGGDIWEGVSKVFKPIVRTFGKVMGSLGPIGSIALSFVLPGLGTMLSSLWTAASSVLPAGLVSAVNTGISWASKAMSTLKGLPGKALGKLGETTIGQAVKTGYQSITDKISSAFEYVGGKVSDGAANMFSSAKEYLGLKQAPTDISSGQWISEGAQKSMVDNALSQNPELIKMANASGTSVTDLARAQVQSTTGFTSASQFGTTQSFNLADNPELAGKMSSEQVAAQSEFLTQKTADKVIAQNPEFVKMANASIDKAAKNLPADQTSGITAQGLANQQSNFLQETRGLESAAALEGQVKPKVEDVAKESILDRVLKAASNSFAESTPTFGMPQPFIATGSGDISNLSANRFGVGGQGAAGGQFVDPAILAMLQANAKQLEELG